ncbi:hypothetical protein BC833DRAFT_617406 [Globomyces pollinis-pini]|nr:hypothetical protein BC833DRAFT_617406 [Globomyces pollinis-pini]
MNSDQLEIQNLIHSFFHCIDDYHYNPDDFVNKFQSLFAKDAQFEFPYRNVSVQNHEDNLKNLCTKMATNFKGFNHVEYNVVIELNGNLATNQSYWAAYDKGQMTSLGRHYDEFVKEDGKWLFKYRLVRLRYSLQDGNVIDK